MTAIDYMKAFDSVNRADIMKTLKLYKIDAKIVEATLQMTRETQQQSGSMTGQKHLSSHIWNMPRL